MTHSALIMFLLGFISAGCGAHWRNEPGSCKAAAIQSVADAFSAKGTTPQAVQWEYRCATDKAVAAAAAANEAQVVQMAQLREIERQRLEIERRREERELALLKAQADAARTHADAVRMNTDDGTAPEAALASTQPSKMLLFGGHDHKIFLGCFCDESEEDSVLNKYGRFGNRYSSEPSIWNRYGEFGSKYSSTSACNPYALDPPIVVTETGKALGFLTENRYMLGAITDEAVQTWLSKVVCEGS